VLVDTVVGGHAAYGGGHGGLSYAGGPASAYAAAAAAAAAGLDQPSWFEMRAVTDSHINHIVPVTAVLADPAEELIWSGLDNVPLSPDSLVTCACCAQARSHAHTHTIGLRHRDD
jgi:hypothetical protein